LRQMALALLSIVQPYIAECLLQSSASNIAETSVLQAVCGSQTVSPAKGKGWPPPLVLWCECPAKLLA
jgi:hypothetical protein